MKFLAKWKNSYVNASLSAACTFYSHLTLNCDHQKLLYKADLDKHKNILKNQIPKSMLKTFLRCLKMHTLVLFRKIAKNEIIWFLKLLTGYYVQKLWYKILLMYSKVVDILNIFHGKSGYFRKMLKTTIIQLSYSIHSISI